MANTFIHLPPTGSSTITGPIDVNVSAASDSIKISDGTDILAINPDGSLNIAGAISGDVNAVVTGLNEYSYNEVTIAAGATQTVLSQLFPTEYKLRRVRSSGENIGVYFLKFGASGVDKYRSTYTDFNALMDFETGITIPAGTTVSIEVTNNGTTPGLFSSQFLYSSV